MGKVVLKTNLQMIALKKKDAWVTRSVTYSRIDADELLNRAAANSGIRRGIIYQAADAINNEFANFLMNGHSVELPLIGTFRFGVNAHVADTEEAAGADKVYRRKLIYRPSTELRRLALNVNFIQTEKAVASDDGSNGGEG